MAVPSLRSHPGVRPRAVPTMVIGRINRLVEAKPLATMAIPRLRIIRPIRQATMAMAHSRTTIHNRGMACSRDMVARRLASSLITGSHLIMDSNLTTAGLPPDSTHRMNSKDMERLHLIMEDIMAARRLPVPVTEGHRLTREDIRLTGDRNNGVVVDMDTPRILDKVRNW